MCSRNHCRSLKAVNLLHPECVFVDVFIQHKKRMCRIIFTFVACFTLPYILSLLHKEQGYGIESNTECASWFLTMFPWITSHFKKNWYDIFVYIQETLRVIPNMIIYTNLNFLYIFRRNTQILNYKAIFVVTSNLLDAKLHTWSKYPHFAITLTRMKCWLVSLVSFQRPCMKLTKCTFN